MAVVINEFEVVSEPPPEPASPTPAPAPSAQPRFTLAAYEVARVAQREAERLLRIWAH